jgi:2-octaprenylphenol hydroxylase
MHDAVKFDVAIVGAGPIGATAAALLARQGVARVALIDRHEPVVASGGGAHDLRVFALSRASEKILRSAGAWHDIVGARACAYECMRVWHASVPPRGGEALVFRADEAGERDLGHIVENRVLQSAAFAAARRERVAFIAGDLEQLHVDERAVGLRVGSRTVRARLVVGADGAASRVRALSNLGTAAADYLQAAIVCIVRTAKPHERTAWQRFLGDGTLALLPLKDGTSSIVWSVPVERAERLATLDASAFSAALTRDSDDVLGAIELVSDRATVPLRKLSAEAYVRERVALIGDAAHVIHPLAGQGANLGLLDAAALADVLQQGAAEHEDPGALRLLRRYERWRRAENQAVSVAMDVFNRFLAQGSGPVSALAQRGLALVNRSDWAKRWFIERALGATGELPAAAR